MSEGKEYKLVTLGLRHFNFGKIFFNFYLTF